MERLIAGAMSGTSADGVDVALVRIGGRGTDMTAKLVAHHHHRTTRRCASRFSRCEAASHCASNSLHAARERFPRHTWLRSKMHMLRRDSAREIAAIAAHGQTMFHAPPDTMQVLDPALLAAETGCAVVSDFRRADCAAGGQGAPLVPFADYVLFRHPRRARVLLNIGGIANLTFIPRARPRRRRRIRHRPGNCVSDWLCRTRGPFGLSWDVDGAGASRGRVIPAVRDRFLASPFLSAPPPKSTDGPAMIESFDAAASGSEYELNDLLATAAYVRRAPFLPAFPPCRRANPRAGSRRQRRRAAQQGDHGLAAVDARGRGRNPPERRTSYPAEAKEAVAFALLAAATLGGLPSNVPSATGARRSVVLGSITPKP
jgi:anhydro-N-acetylmuramic acid kinase